jgi:hypothetical protein
MLGPCPASPGAPAGAAGPPLPYPAFSVREAAFFLLPAQRTAGDPAANSAK